MTAPLAVAAGVLFFALPFAQGISLPIALGVPAMVGVMSTALAGWRYRRIFWAWPLCYAAGPGLLLWLLHPDALWLADTWMTLAGGTFPMLVGAALPALWWWLQPRHERAVRLWAVATGAISVLAGWMAWAAAPVVFRSAVPWGAPVPEMSAAVFFMIGVGLGLLAGRQLWRLSWAWPPLVGCGLILYALVYAERFFPDGWAIILAICVPVWVGTVIPAQWMRWRESRTLLMGH